MPNKPAITLKFGWWNIRLKIPGFELSDGWLAPPAVVSPISQHH